MSAFIRTFKDAAASVIAECNELHHVWVSDQDEPKETLHIPATDPNGYDITLECWGYGLYPRAGGWRGAPWDVTGWPLNRFAASVTDFLFAALSPEGELQVFYSDGTPCKWVLRTLYEGAWVSDPYKLPSVRCSKHDDIIVFRNSTLPPNRAMQRTVTGGASPTGFCR